MRRPASSMIVSRSVTSSIQISAALGLPKVAHSNTRLYAHLSATSRRLALLPAAVCRVHPGRCCWKGEPQQRWSEPFSIWCLAASASTQAVTQAGHQDNGQQLFLKEPARTGANATYCEVTIKYIACCACCLMTLLMCSDLHQLVTYCQAQAPPYTTSV